MGLFHDTIIIGGGCTGLATAMYAGRLGLKTLLLAGNIGGTITTTDNVENYPGFIRLTGQELADKLREHAEDYKEFVTIVKDFATDVKKVDNLFSICTKDNCYMGKTVIFATGTKSRELDVPGNNQYRNKGAHYCALCDGYFYKGKITAVVGGSDSAAKEALVLAQLSKKVYIIYRREKIRAEPVNAKRVEEMVKKGKIEIITNTNVVEIKGDGSKVTSVVLDNPYKGSKALPLDGLFISIGLIPLSDLAKKVGVATNKKDEIIIDKESKTNVAGVYAAGDVADTKFKQAITGVAEGVAAAYEVYEYVNKQLVIPQQSRETGKGKKKSKKK